MPKNIIKNSIRETFSIIKENKKDFLFILLLQVFLVFVIALINVFFMAKILQSTINAVEYTENLELNAQNPALDILQQKNPLGEDPLLISENYNNIVKNMILLLISVFAIIVLVNSYLWYLSSNIINKTKHVFSMKGFIPYLVKFLIISLLLFIFGLLMSNNLVNMFFSSFLLTEPQVFIPLLIISIIAIYFLQLSIPIIYKNKLKTLPKKVFSVGINNLIPIVISYVIILTTAFISLYFMFKIIELNIIFLFVGFILFFLVLVWNRIFFIIVVKELSGL